MKRLSRLSAIALGAMLSTVAVPALVVSGAATEAQAATLSGGFDVGPGGFQGNFNPLAATAGFTWLSIYYEPSTTNRWSAMTRRCRRWLAHWQAPTRSARIR